jgi:hypothetical protein
VTETNVFELTQPGTFSDPLTEVLRNGARTLLGLAVEAEVAAVRAITPASIPSFERDWSRLARLSSVSTNAARAMGPPPTADGQPGLGVISPRHGPLRATRPCAGSPSRSSSR